MELNEILSYELDYQGVTQKELALNTGMNAVSVNRVIKNRRPLQSHELKAISEFLNVSSDYLLGLSPKRNISSTNNDNTDMYYQLLSILSSLPNINIINDNISQEKLNFIIEGFNAILKLSDYVDSVNKGKANQHSRLR